MTTNIIRLTDAAFSQARYVFYTTSVSSQNGLSISFDFYSYGGNGADGLSFFFMDGAQTPKLAGGFGGSLGYAQLQTDPNNPATSIPGLQGGYLGIGFDEYGYFSAPEEGRIGGPGLTADAIAVRGSQANNYAYLTGTGTLPLSLDNPGPTATRENSRRRAQIDLSPTGTLFVKVDLNNDGDFADAGENAISNFDVVGVNGALPSTFKFGFAASTGGNTNIHEIGNFSVKTFNGTPVPGNFTDDYILGGAIPIPTTPGVNPTPITGGDTNDLLIGGPGKDTLDGGVGKDILIGYGAGDILIGGEDADRFVYSGTTQAAALQTSTLRRRDRITDFNPREGDRIQLDFDDNLSTVELPKKLFNAGTISARNLQRAARAAFADKNNRKRGNQILRPNEAVMFGFKNRFFMVVNNNRKPFSPQQGLMVELTNSPFLPGDATRNTLTVTNYFA